MDKSCSNGTGTTTTVFGIEGMSCMHCVKSVEESLLSFSEIVEVKVDLGKNQATLKHYDDLDLEEVKAKIIGLGYSVST